MGGGIPLISSNSTSRVDKYIFVKLLLIIMLAKVILSFGSLVELYEFWTSTNMLETVDNSTTS